VSTCGHKIVGNRECANLLACGLTTVRTDWECVYKAVVYLRLLLLAERESAPELCITLGIIEVQHMENHPDRLAQADHGGEEKDAVPSIVKL
jgi:hypothetical protein